MWWHFIWSFSVSIIVAAYKMGLVHEKEVVKTPATLSTIKQLGPDTGVMSTDVLEVRDKPTGGNAASSAT